VCGQHWKGHQRPARVPHHLPKKKGCSPQNFNASLFPHQNQVQPRKRPDELRDLGSLRLPKKVHREPQEAAEVSAEGKLEVRVFPDLEQGEGMG